MRAVIFGQSGTAKTDYLKQVQNVALAQGRGFDIINLGDEMRGIDPAKRDPQTYPSLPLSEQQLLRETALNAVIRRLDKSRDVVLIAHAVFQTDTALVAASLPDLLARMAPEIVAVIVDDFHYTHRRLAGTPFEKLPLASVLQWRSAEVTESLAATQRFLGTLARDTPAFVVARGHSPTLLYRLLYERADRRRVYGSFPITGMDSTELGEIRRFSERMAADHIYFDPLKMRERKIISILETALADLSQAASEDGAVQAGTDHLYESLLSNLKKSIPADSPIKIPSKSHVGAMISGVGELEYKPGDEENEVRDDNPEAVLFEQYRFPIRELEALKDLIDGQIVSRDFLLIDQSDLVCAYVPWDKAADRPRVSPGSQSELTYAKLKGKPTYVVCRGRHDKLSPWIKQQSTSLFQTLEELEAYLA